MSKMLKLLEKTREYLDYVEQHYLFVQTAWKDIQNKCQDMDFVKFDQIRERLDREIKEHDISKLSAEEFTQYRDNFFNIGEPTKDDKEAFLNAWEHHKIENPHHWERWTMVYGYSSNRDEWKLYCVHMVVDWMAMGYKFNDTAQEYFEKNRDRIDLPSFAVGYLYEIFKRLYK